MFEAYHGVTGAQHQTNFNRLSGQGYRMISLSVYGQPGDAHYACEAKDWAGARSIRVHLCWYPLSTVVTDRLRRWPQLVPGLPHPQPP